MKFLERNCYSFANQQSLSLLCWIFSVVGYNKKIKKQAQVCSMNEKNFELAEHYVPHGYVQQGKEARKNLEKNIRILLEQVMQFDANFYQYLCAQPVFTCLNSTMRTLRTMCEFCSTLSIKTPEQCRWRRCVFIANFEQISRIVLMSPLLTLNR